MEEKEPSDLPLLLLPKQIRMGLAEQGTRRSFSFKMCIVDMSVEGGEPYATLHMHFLTGTAIQFRTTM